MAPKTDAPADGVPPAVSGPLGILTAREQTIMLQSLLTIKGFPTVSCPFRTGHVRLERTYLCHSVMPDTSLLTPKQMNRLPSRISHATSPHPHIRPPTRLTRSPNAALTAEQGVQIDYQKVADRMGLSNPRSVSNAWTLIKKKIAEFDKNDRKQRGLPSEDEAETEDAEAGGDGNPTPKKRARTKAAASATTPRRGKAAAAGGSAKKPRGKKATGGMLADLGVPAGVDVTAALAGDEEDDDEMLKKEEALKLEAGMIKLEREIDENGVESYISGEI
jgi:hypothetical protein